MIKKADGRCAGAINCTDLVDAEGTTVPRRSSKQYHRKSQQTILNPPE
jgi:hypothetical protein